MKLKRRKKDHTAAQRRVMATFAQLTGDPNTKFDRSSAGNGTTVRVLSVKQNRDLFRRCVEFDFDYLMGLKFAAAKDNLQYLLPQSVLGRALYGHGWFVDDDGAALRFSDATFDAVCTVLENAYPQLSNLKVRAERNRQIERLKQLVLNGLKQPTLALFDTEGSLFGIDFLRGREVETIPFLRGMVLAGWMDAYDWRIKTLRQKPDTFNKLPLELGGGDICVVNRERFAEIGLVDCGERVFTTTEIASLHQLGVIEESLQEYHYPLHDQVYFRRAGGLGICDDLAMLYIGKLYGFDAMLGAFLIDAVDTYDKFLLNFWPGGMDAFIARSIEESWRERNKEPLVTSNDIGRLIHFAAKRNNPSTLLSSSHRRFIQYEGKCDQPTLLHHWAFLEEKPLQRIKLGFAGVAAEDFYRMAMERFYASGIYVREAVF